MVPCQGHFLGLSMKSADQIARQVMMDIVMTDIVMMDIVMMDIRHDGTSATSLGKVPSILSI